MCTGMRQATSLNHATATGTTKKSLEILVASFEILFVLPYYDVAGLGLSFVDFF